MSATLTSKPFVSQSNATKFPFGIDSNRLKSSLESVIKWGYIEMRDYGGAFLEFRFQSKFGWATRFRA